ncbi:hypothetical protein DDT91_19840 [Algoriphagus sp. AK58]|nr:hypothetical protein [Algoriphagus sp. AK58]
MISITPFQKRLTNYKFERISDLIQLIFEKPRWYIFIFWSVYFLFDLIATLFLFQEISDFFFPVFNFIGGVPLITFLFFRYFPGIKSRGSFFEVQVELITIFVMIASIKHLLIIFFWGSIYSGFREEIIFEILRTLQFGFFIFILWMLREIVIAMKKIHETDMSLSHLKIAHEQLTLSPHFVLNTLNSIAGQSILFSTDLFHQIGAFSNLMKQSYKNVEEPHFLSDEIEFLKNFLACLHRSKKKCFINLELKQNLPFELVEVPRLLLGTLMENILKYGVCNSKNEQPVFHVNLEESPGGEKILVCYTVNKIDLAKNLPRSGHGLSTLLKILKHKYGDKASLTYSSSNHEFSTFLIIYYGKN